MGEESGDAEELEDGEESGDGPVIQAARSSVLRRRSFRISLVLYHATLFAYEKITPPRCPRSYCLWLL